MEDIVKKINEITKINDIQSSPIVEKCFLDMKTILQTYKNDPECIYVFIEIGIRLFRHFSALNSHTIVFSRINEHLGVLYHILNDSNVKENGIVSSSSFCIEAFQNISHKLSKRSQQRIIWQKKLVELGLVIVWCWLKPPESKMEESSEKLLQTIVTLIKDHDDLKLEKTQVYFFCGLIELRKKCYKLAITYFEQSLELNQPPFSPLAIHYWLAAAHMLTKDFEASSMYYQKSITENYCIIESLNNDSFVKIQQNDVQGAVVQLRRALELDFTQLITMFNFSILYEKVGDFKAKQQMLQYLLDAINENSEKNTMKGDSLCFSVECFSSRKDDPSLALVYRHLAESSIHIGDWTTAHTAFETLLDKFLMEVTPAQLKKMCRDYAFVLLQCNFPTKALELCSKYLSKSFPDDLYLMMYKADALISLEMVDECHCQLTEIDKLIKEKTDIPLSYQIQLFNNRALVCECMGENKNALGLLINCNDLMPDSTGVVFNLTLLYWKNSSQRVSASSLWLQHRDFKADGDDIYYQKLLDDCYNVQSRLGHKGIQSHVPICSIDMTEEISPLQIAILDQLILQYWMSIYKTDSIQCALKIFSGII